MYIEIRKHGSDELISDKLRTVHFGGILPQLNDILHIRPKDCVEKYKEKGFKGIILEREYIKYDTCILRVFEKK